MTWCARVVELFNSDPDFPLASEGWSGDIGVVVDRPGQSLVVHVGAPVGGKLPAPTQVASADELDAKDPAYWLRASEATWRDMMGGRKDPVEAVLRRELEVRGELQPVMERLRYKGLAYRVLARLTAEGL